jgi:hypothetical protein
MRFRFLAPAYIDGCLFQAGQICEMKDDWVPGPFVEPLDLAGAKPMFDAGPQVLGLVRQQFSDLILTRYPTTFWKPVDAAKETWELTGLGSGLGVKRWTSDAAPGALP